MAGRKESPESSFFLFLPRHVSDDPGADIEKGPRHASFIGEVVNFFLIAQYCGKNRTEAKLRDWQRKILRLNTSVSVSCVDLASFKEEDNDVNRFINCYPVSSYNVETPKKRQSDKVQVSSPCMTRRGDIIYPLTVSLDSLPPMARRIKLSVNIWTPELNILPETLIECSKDFQKSFSKHDPNMILETLKSSFRLHVNATLPIVAPPSLRCRYTHAYDKHYLSVEVINSLGETANIKSIQIHPSLEGEMNLGTNFSKKNVKSKQMRLPGVDIIPVTLKKNNQSVFPTKLQPWEHHSYLFRLIYHDKYIQSKCCEVCLVAAVSWNVDTLDQQQQQITTRYSLPTFNIKRSSMTVSASCAATVCREKRFKVKYTVTNKDVDDSRVRLQWQPSRTYHLLPGLHNVSLDSLICLQPDIDLGLCPSGSSLSTEMSFVALEPGLHEVGKFMTVDRDTDERNPTDPMLVSQPCQIYVTQTEVPVSSC